MSRFYSIHRVVPSSQQNVLVTCPWKNPCTYKESLAIPHPHPQPLATAHHALSYRFARSGRSYKWGHVICGLCVWLVSLACSQGSSTLEHVSALDSFYGRKIFHCQAAAHFVVLSSVGRQKRCLPLGYENINTMAVCVQVSVWTRVPGSRLCAEAWGCWANGDSVSNVWRSLQTVSRAAASLRLPSSRVRTGPGSAPTLLIVLFEPRHLSWGEGVLTRCPTICISLRPDDERPFSGLSAICVADLEKWLFKSCAEF